MKSGRKKGSIPWNKGKIGLQKHSQETIEKIRIAAFGRKHTNSELRKMSESQLGKKRKPLTLEHREKLRVAFSGKNTHLWKGGVTSVNQLIRTSFQYRAWRISVFKRDNYSCTKCGKRSGNGRAVVLHADHIKPFAFFPELRFELSNGRTLCIECHRKTETYARRSPIKVTI